MITYSTKFPIKESLDKKPFVEMVIKWNQGSNTIGLTRWIGMVNLFRQVGRIMIKS